VVGYVWRPWGVHIDIVRDRGSKGLDGCPLTPGTTLKGRRLLYSKSDDFPEVDSPIVIDSPPPTPLVP
jgi:hypothetical protein